MKNDISFWNVLIAGKEYKFRRRKSQIRFFYFLGFTDDNKKCQLYNENRKDAKRFIFKVMTGKITFKFKSS